MKCLADDYMTRQELCEYLSIGSTTSMDLIHYRVVEAFVIGRRWLISKKSVDELLRKLPDGMSLNNLVAQAKKDGQRPRFMRVGGRNHE